MTAARMRNGVILAVKLEVHCPFCKRPQPTGGRPGYTWEPDDVRRVGGLDLNCVWCGEKFLMIYANRVSVVK
jgi:hypothetical protein